MREPIVSRTFNGVDIKALCVKEDTREVFEVTVFIERLPKEKPEKVDAFIRSRVEAELEEGQKFISVLEKNEATKRFYLTETEFISLARETDLLKRSENNEESEVDENDDH